MSAPTKVRPLTAEIPPVPLTLEGSSVLHQMLRFRWAEWRQLNPGERNRILNEAQPVLQEMERHQIFRTPLALTVQHIALV